MCHTWTLWSVDMQDLICVRPDQRVLESWTFVKFLQIHKRERLCLKPLPQFSSHPNETCYIKSIWRVDVHHVLVWGLTQRFQGYVPFFKTLICAYREGVLIFFHSFQVNNTNFFMFCLIFCDKAGKGGIFITMNDSAFFFWHPNQFFKTVICTTELFGNGSWVF